MLLVRIQMYYFYLILNYYKYLSPPSERKKKPVKRYLLHRLFQNLNFNLLQIPAPSLEGGLVYLSLQKN